MPRGTDSVFARVALLPSGWAKDVTIEWSAGRISRVDSGQPALSSSRRCHVVLPGIPNLHSHAFQRILSGLTEATRSHADSFWSWRELMYKFLGVLDPDSIEDICAYVFAEMLRAGYTSVAEFHYVHNQAGGQPYNNPAELSFRVVQAARKAGIGITHLPVVYERGGFAETALTALQKRLACDVDRAVLIAEAISATYRSDQQVSIGLAPHSLRAVEPGKLGRIATVASKLARHLPIHIHVSEQVQEVNECIAQHQTTPINLLCDSVQLNSNWCLIHCTHATEQEFVRIAAARAVIGLCPTTEANLGDGTIDLVELMKAGALFGIGSDSQISIDPKEEWRILEYSQRLARRQRNIAVTAGHSVGRTLFQNSVEAAESVIGRPVGRIATGHVADLIELKQDDPALALVDRDELLDFYIFASNRPAISTVIAAGQTVVVDGRHCNESDLAERYRRAMERLRSAL
jgi:formimidoylglutamate deiminase